MPALYGRGLNVCLRWSRPRKYLFDLVKLLYWQCFCPSRFRAMPRRATQARDHRNDRPPSGFPRIGVPSPATSNSSPAEIPRTGLAELLFWSRCEKSNDGGGGLAKRRPFPRGGRRNHLGLRYPLEAVGDAGHGSTSAAAPVTGSTLRPRSSRLSRQAWSGFRRSSSPRPASGRAASRLADC